MRVLSLVQSRFVVVALALGGCLGPSAIPDLTRPLLLDPDTRIVIDVHFVEGYEPSRHALAEFLRALADVAGKADVTLRMEVIPDRLPSTSRQWSHDEVQSLERQLRSDVPFDLAYLHVLYLDGRGDAERGIQWGSAIAIWPDSSGLEAAPMVPTDDVAMETATLLHELGHAMGLVGCGTPVIYPRQVSDGSCHSTNEESVMRQFTDEIDGTVNDARTTKYVPRWYDSEDVAEITAYRSQLRREAGLS